MLAFRHQYSEADWLSDSWSLRVSPVKFTRVMVGSLVFAPATHAVPDCESGFAFIATSLGPCHLCRRVSLHPRRRDGSIYHFKLCGRRFALVVFRLVRLRIVPFSVPCCPSYFCFGLRCACLNRFWLCVKFSAVTCCCLTTRFADQAFPPLSLLFFSPTMSWCFNMTLQVFAVMLRWVVLTPACPEIVPFALPLFVINLFERALRLIKQGMRRIQRCELFFVCQRLLRI